MAAYAYEAAQQWPAALEQARREPDYEAAYEEAEPLVTVRIATYNRAQLLCDRAVASVRGQSYENWELLVVGDACTDDTEQRLRAIGDERIRFMNLPYSGPYPSDDLARWRVQAVQPINTALRDARGRWICALDDDDEFLPDHIERMLAHAQSTRAELAYGRIRTVDYDGGGPVDVDMSQWPLRRGAFNFLSSISHAALRRFEFDPVCRFAGEPSDWNMVRRLWEAGVRFSFLDEVVAVYYFRSRVWE